LWIDAGRLVGVEMADGTRIAAARVVLACGGKSWPTLGGTGGGYDLARQAGHTIVEPVPALVPLVTRESWPARLAGVVIHGAGVCIDLPGQPKAGVTGDVLLTHRGLSGPVVLDMSGTVARLLERRGPVPLRIELVAGMDAARWGGQVDEWRRSQGRRRISTLLRDYLPGSLCREIRRQAGIAEGTTVAQLSAPGRDALVTHLSALTLTVTATEGFDVAFVTRGGVRLRDVDPATLAGRCLPNLYLAGELLDIDGPCGGFNLQWAFASGYLAGRSARPNH